MNQEYSAVSLIRLLLSNPNWNYEFKTLLIQITNHKMKEFNLIDYT